MVFLWGYKRTAWAASRGMIAPSNMLFLTNSGGKNSEARGNQGKGAYVSAGEERKRKIDSGKESGVIFVVLYGMNGDV